MSEYKRYNLTLTVADPSARSRFRALSRPESFFEIRPNRSPGQRGAYSVEMTQDEYEAALEDAANPDVNLIAVEPEKFRRLCGVPDANTLAYLAADTADSLGLTGAGVDIGIIDSGLGSALADGVFSGRVKAAQSFLGGDPNDVYDDANGHGSHMASLAVPPGSRVVAAQTANITGSMTDTAKAEAMYWMVDEIGIDILSMSYGSSDASTVESDAISHAYSQNVLMFAARGNDQSDVTNYPAGYSGVHAISSYDNRTDSIVLGGPTYGSSFGLDVFAASTGSLICWLFSDGSEECTELGGTSAATALAAHVAARFMTGGRSPGNAVKYLADNARPTGAGPYYEGNGVLQLAAAERQLQEDKPPKRDLNGDPIEEPADPADDGAGNPDPGACG